MKELVVVAMSGGVDSSVTAALLKKAGHDVIGVTMRLCDRDSSGDEEQAAIPDNIADAQNVARQIGIPHHVVDFRNIFRNEIINPFVEAYSMGLTPNPCIVCNRKIKFGLLAQKARELGAQKLATGHYARIVEIDGRKMIGKARDSAKDQSYFLFTLTNEDLEFILFPLGDYEKTEVRRIAAGLGLAVAEKKESLEICFVHDNDYAGLVEKYSSVVPMAGEIVLSDGTVVGKHGGIHRFTVGQRQGLKVSLGRPMYVLSIDGAGGKVVIGGREECRSGGLVAKGTICNYTMPFRENMEALARIRYRTAPVKCRLYPLSEDRIKIVFVDESPLVTPGQAAVLYKDDVVIGGGWIERPLA